MKNFIRVFPRVTNATPNDDQAYFDGPPLWYAGCDDVHVSCVFTYDKPRAEALADQWSSAGYNVTVGGPAYNDKGGDFVPGRYVKHGMVMTSRGCNNNCWFCSVPKREGKIRELPITEGWNVLDSNLLQCSRGHIRSVFIMLELQKQLGSQIRFTGGLEAAMLEDWHVELLTLLKPYLFYFAYDTADDWDPLRRAAKMVTEAGFNSRQAMCYCLIGYPKDTMDKAEKRLKSVYDLGLLPMAMLYRDYSGKVSCDWAKFQTKWVRPWIIRSRMKSAV